ncbi:MAG: YggT family protein [Anaerolineae bacterium]|nr:YggT family protein [Anaerolineae bacterium]MCZ7553260.1 YggT family protein [Anaerolineales bacterium]
MILVAVIIHRVIQVFILVVVAQAILSFFMDPFHPIRRTIDRIVDPFLAPIRRFLPPIANLDFSPIVLIILLQLIDSIIFRLLSSLA